MIMIIIKDNDDKDDKDDDDNREISQLTIGKSGIKMKRLLWS